MPNQIPDAIKRHRSQELHALAKQQKTEFLQLQTGRHASVLWETRNGDRHFGYTENYARVAVVSDSNDLENTITSCSLKTVCEEHGGHLTAALH